MNCYGFSGNYELIMYEFLKYECVIFLDLKMHFSCGEGFVLIYEISTTYF